MTGKRTLTLLTVAAVAVVGLASCSTSGGGAATTAAPASSEPTGPAARIDCRGVTDLFPGSVVLGYEDGWCRDWVDLARGRAVLGSTGSAALWSRRTGHGTALLVGAIHTLGEGWFGPAGTAVSASISDPGEQTGIPRLFLPLPGGSGPDALASLWYEVYRPDIAAERNGNRMQDVLPREDFYLAVTDTQKLDVSGPIPTPDPIVFGDVSVYDPLGVTLADPTYAAAEPGALVLLLGYPNEGRELAGSVGRILDDEEATAAVAELGRAGDPEGAVAYDPEAEFVIEGAAVAGMSGGPVVDDQGRLIGMLVRASDVHDGVQYVRAVRMAYVVDRLAAALDALDPEARAAVAGYLER